MMDRLTKSAIGKMPKSIFSFEFVDRYVWEIAVRSALEEIMLEDGMVLIAVSWGKTFFWFDGGTDYT